MATNAVSRMILHLRRAALLQEGCTLADGVLLESYISRRDEAAFEALVRRHGPMVLGVCRRILRNEADAEDAFQATFLVLVRKASSIQPRGQVSNWLYGVARNTALKARAMIRKRRIKEREAGTVPKPEAAKEVWQQMEVMLDAELSQLPDKYRVPIVLCALEGKTIKEAARHLGWPQGTVATRLSRGRALLAKRLSKHGLEFSGGVLAALLSEHVASACLPSSLVSSTVKAATVLAAGAPAASVVPAKVAALAEGVLKAMLVSKLQNTVAVLVVLAVLFGGAGMLMQTTLVAQQTESKNDDNKVSGDGDKPQAAPKPVVVRQDAILQRMALRPDGEVLATVGVTHDGSTYNSTVKLWDARTGKLKRALDEEKDSHLEITFSRDFLAIGVNGKLQDTDPRGPREVRLLDAKTLELKHRIDETLVPGIRAWTALAFSPDGKRLAVAGDVEGAFLKLWDVEKEQFIEGKADLGDIPREQNRVSCLAFSPDGKLVAAAWRDAKIRLFDGQTGEFGTLLDTERESFGLGVGVIAFSPDSKTLASKGNDNTVVLWDLTEGKPRRTLKGQKGEVDAVAYSRDGRWIAAGGRAAKENVYEVILWDARTGEVKQTFSDLTEWIHVVAFSPDGKTLAVCGGGGTGEGKDIKTSGEITLFRLE
jgi:RNA polymerase sigma factor (sigma-70 family)